MTFAEYINKSRFDIRFDRSTALPCIALGISGEAGEIADRVKKIYRDRRGYPNKEDRENLIEEMGDLLWYIARLCDEEDINIDEVMEKNIEKIESKYDKNN